MPHIELKKNEFIRESNQSVIHEYSFDEKIGRGNFGTVYSVTHQATGQKRAMKILEKGAYEKLSENQKFKKEIDIMKNVVRLCNFRTIQTFCGFMSILPTRTSFTFQWNCVAVGTYSVIHSLLACFQSPKVANSFTKLSLHFHIVTQKESFIETSSLRIFFLQRPLL